jgi:hypothetical protein
MEINTKVCWLGNLVSEDQLHEIARGIKADRSHDKFLYPYTKQGEIGFFPLETVAQQAFCQHLAHLGCIPATLLFGYSLSFDYIGTPRVICPHASIEYLFAGISAFLIHHRDKGFEREFAYFWGNYWFHEICRHVLEWFWVNAPDDHTHPVREFCEWWVANTGGTIHRLDS